MTRPDGESLADGPEPRRLTRVTAAYAESRIESGIEWGWDNKPATGMKARRSTGKLTGIPAGVAGPPPGCSPGGCGKLVGWLARQEAPGWDVRRPNRDEVTPQPVSIGRPCAQSNNVQACLSSLFSL